MAPTCRLTQVEYRGFPAYELANQALALTVIPGLGGKIASIRQLPTNREWLWASPYLAYRPPVYGASYIREFDLGGLDECFPSVAPTFFPGGPWAGTPVPDHGELWAQPWEVIATEDTPAQVSVTLACYGVRFPYRFERSVTLTGDAPAAQLAYRVTNLSPFPLPFLWSIHPLLPLAPGMRLTLPAGVDRVRVDFATGDWLGKMGALQPWPVVVDAAGHPMDLSVIPPASFGRGVKLFTLPLPGSDPVTTTLADAAGDHSFSFRFLPAEVTHVGVWINCAGWTPLAQPPYYNLALEPCIGASDSLTVAVDHWREHGRLEPRAERRWSLTILLT